MYKTHKKKIKPTHVCTECHSSIFPVVKKQGLFFMEVAVWILSLFIAPQTAGASVLIAIGYSAFRLLSKKMVCPKCKSDDIILNDTDIAKKIIQEQNEMRGQFYV
jgi:Zn finger protein HypA/HybF involved in hydrogenase expression